MKILCVGGGPAGLYFAILMKRRNPAHDIAVVERNPAGQTTGWGLVFTAGMLERLDQNDPPTGARIRERLIAWDDVNVTVSGRRVVTGGHGFLGISRLAVITVLQQRAAELGIAVDYERRFDADELETADADLIVIADGATSRLRDRYRDAFGAVVDVRPNKYIWLGTRKTFDNEFAFLFERTEAGWLWAHCYQFDAETSTFVVECTDATWRGLGFDAMPVDDAVARCETLFAPYLDGHPLMADDAQRRRSSWTNFGVVRCRTWHHGKIVLLGNAAHSAHFSIGSGTRLALEDAAVLADCLDGRDRPDAESLARYQRTRQAASGRLHDAAVSSMLWFEAVEAYLEQDPQQFTYALLTRSQRIGHEGLRQRDPAWLETVADWFQATHGRTGEAAKQPPSTLPRTLRGVTLPNRVVVDLGTGATGSTADGMPPAGLRIGEVVVDPDRPADDPAYAEAFARLAEDRTGARPDARLGVRLVAGAPAVGGRPDPARAAETFAAAAAAAARAGVDLVELDAAADPVIGIAAAWPAGGIGPDAAAEAVGPSLAAFRAVRAVWPADRPLSVRLGAATDAEGRALAPRELRRAAGRFRAEGVDVLDVPLDERFHLVGEPRIAGQETLPAVLAVGSVRQADLVDALILAGRADLYSPGPPGGAPSADARVAAQ